MFSLKAKVDTILKKKPEQSSTLNAAEKVDFLKGELLEVESYVTETAHFKVTLAQPIQDEKIWYVFPDFVTIENMANAVYSEILQAASASPISTYQWQNRGIAPVGYIKGMALVYARAYCKLKAADAAAIEMAKANTGDPARDALAYYAEEFRAIGISNNAAGTVMLRCLFVLLMGLGMRESSGRYCEGRDRSAANTTADTAEAGLFQTSYDAKAANSLMKKLFQQYSTHPAGFVDIFQEGVRCSNSDFENFGDGEGRAFQELSKACPAFAVEFAGVGLRNLRKHWGPINRKEVEVRPECDALLLQVQRIVDSSDLCPALQ